MNFKNFSVIVRLLCEIQNHFQSLETNFPYNSEGLISGIAVTILKYFTDLEQIMLKGIFFYAQKLVMQRTVCLKLARKFRK